MDSLRPFEPVDCKECIDADAWLECTNSNLKLSKDFKARLGYYADADADADADLWLDSFRLFESVDCKDSNSSLKRRHDAQVKWPF